jgi:hypothetical protein
MSESTNPGSPAEPSEAVEPVSPPEPVAPASAAPQKSGLGIAALVLGIVAIVMAIIPGPSFAAFIPAILAGIFGVVTLRRTTSGRGGALTGTILGPVALLVAIIVSIVTIAAGAGAVNQASSGGDGSSTKSVTAPKPSPTKTIAPIPASVTYTGKGDSVVKIAIPDGAGQIGAATITYRGSDNFTVWSLDSNLAQQDLMVNTIGSYSGTVLFNNQLGADASSLQVTASGPWSITLKSIRALDRITGASASGTGDNVLIYTGRAAPATITSTGRDNFVVWEYGDDSNLLVNEIGAYNGTVPFAAGPALIAINATGRWTISLG